MTKFVKETDNKGRTYIIEGEEKVSNSPHYKGDKVFSVKRFICEVQKQETEKETQEIAEIILVRLNETKEVKTKGEIKSALDCLRDAWNKKYGVQPYEKNHLHYNYEDLVIEAINNFHNQSHPPAYSKEEIEKLAKDFYQHEEFKGGDIGDLMEAATRQAMVNGFISGFISSQSQGGYSEEDLTEFADWIRKEAYPSKDNILWFKNNNSHHRYTTSELLKLHLKNKK